MAAIWFDCDGCLVDSLTGTSCRPGARALLEMIRSRGAAVVVWSAGGARHARDRIDAVGLGALVDACFSKDQRDEDGRWRLARCQPELAPLGFVDDQPEQLPATATVIAVAPFIGPDDHCPGSEAISDACLECLDLPGGGDHAGRSAVLGRASLG